MCSALSIDPLPSLSAEQAPVAAGLDLNRLRHATVLVGGAGNIGSPLCRLLAHAGVGVIRVVDRDRVEEKNRTNQDYLPAEVGCFKAEALARRLGEQFPHVHFEPRATEIENLPLGDCAVQVLCGAFDSRRARQCLVSEMAWPMNIPVVDGGVGEGYLGRVQVFVPGPTSACLECTWAEADYKHMAAEYPCTPGASAAGLPTPSPAFAGAVVAGIMAAECVQILAGQPPAQSHEIAFDLGSRRFLSSRLRRARRCRYDHEIVGEFIRLEREFGDATVADLLNTVRRRFGSVAVHLELRRGLQEARLFGAARFASLDQLAVQAPSSLASFGFMPNDWIRVRGPEASVFLLLDGKRTDSTGDMP